METLKDKITGSGKIEKPNRYQEVLDISSDWISRNKGISDKSYYRLEKREFDLKDGDFKLHTLLDFYHRQLMSRGVIGFFQSPSGSDPVRLEVNNYIWSVPASLNPVADQIEEAKEILEYDLDWDEDGGLPTNNDTFGKAASFVVEYSLWIFRRYGSVLPAPYIDIMKDGAISVLWEADRGQLLIIFEKEELLAEEEKDLGYFYAEKKPDGIPFKGAVRVGDPVEEFVAIWMKENLL